MRYISGRSKAEHISTGIRAVMAILAAALLVLTAAVGNVQAAGNVDPSVPGSITVTINEDEYYVPGATFRLYQVASLDQNLQFTLANGFAGAGISQKDIQPAEKNLTENPGATAAQWESMASKLDTAVRKSGISEYQNAQQMQNRQVTFNNLTAGLYLICGDQTTVGNKTVTYQPVVVCLPQGGTAADADWSYQVTSHVKNAQAVYTQKPVNPEKPTTPTRTVKTPSLLHTVKTGDTGHIALWIGIICAAAVVVIVLIVAGHKRRKN